MFGGKSQTMNRPKQAVAAQDVHKSLVPLINLATTTMASLEDNTSAVKDQESLTEKETTTTEEESAKVTVEVPDGDKEHEGPQGGSLLGALFGGNGNTVDKNGMDKDEESAAKDTALEGGDESGKAEKTDEENTTPTPAQSWLGALWTDASGNDGADKEKEDQSETSGQAPWYYGGGLFQSGVEETAPENPRVQKAKEFGGAALVGGITGLMFAGPIGGLVLGCVVIGVAVSDTTPGLVVRKGGTVVVNRIASGGETILRSFRPNK